MTAVPPPVPPEIVEKAAKAVGEHFWHGPGRADDDREYARAALAAVYGDIVEAATTAAYDVCARQLASQRDAYEADYDRAVEAARRDALTEAARLLADDGELDAAYTVHELAGLLRAEDSDATAPPRAPTATVSDQQPESGPTPVRDSEGPQKRSEPFPPWVMQAMDDHQQQAEARMRRLLGAEGDA